MDPAVTILLNPLVNLGMLVLLFLVVRTIVANDQIAAVATILTGLTPQYYYLWNSRTKGLSGRGFGALLFLALGLVGLHAAATGGYSSPHLLIASVIVCIILYSSIFALQGVVLIAVAMALIFRDLFLLAAFLGGLTLFIGSNWRYATGYLVGLWGYWNRYRTEMAARFILLDRPSVYRDFIYDFPRRLLFGPSKAGALLYMYSNPIVIVAFLSPLLILSGVVGWHQLRWQSFSPPVAWAIQLSIAATAVCAVTSLRPLRFVGEPDRYVELIVPFAMFALASLIATLQSAPLLVGVLCYLVLTNIIQASVAIALRRRAQRQNDLRTGLLETLRSNLATSARPASRAIVIGNDSNLVTSLLTPDLMFVHYWPAEPTFAGFQFSKAFPRYPMLAPDVLVELVNKFRVTHIVFDSAAEGAFPSVLRGLFQPLLGTGPIELWCRRDHLCADTPYPPDSAIQL
jgi:hypothetical protein